VFVQVCFQILVRNTQLAAIYVNDFEHIPSYCVTFCTILVDVRKQEIYRQVLC